MLLKIVKNIEEQVDKAFNIEKEEKERKLKQSAANPMQAILGDDFKVI